jgi:hypothetical protein
VGGYLALIIGLFLYSYTQVDLNLTLSELSLWQVFQKFFQHIGYFDRPFSTILFVVIVLLIFLFYILFLRLARFWNIRGFWILIIATTLVLTFSYNAFSYDLFNYIFDAKIVTFYHQNPYEHKALDYLYDPWITFMRSTHRVYPYGLTWLGLTIPLSFLGFNVFLPTLYLFKALMAASFLGTVYFLKKIIDNVKIQNAWYGISLFAFNPLVLIESLVSAHNDIVMMFFAIFALYLLLSKKYIFSFTFLAVSIGIKFATVLLLPVFIYIAIMQLKNKTIDLKKIFMIIFILMCIAVAMVSFSSGTNKNPELQPWYFLIALPFAALVAQKKLVAILTICVSLGMLASYIPYIQTGEWPKDITDLKIKLLIYSIGITVFLSIVSSKRIYTSIRNILK